MRSRIGDWLFSVFTRPEMLQEVTAKAGSDQEGIGADGVNKVGNGGQGIQRVLSVERRGRATGGPLAQRRPESSGCADLLVEEFRREIGSILPNDGIQFGIDLEATEVCKVA
jgi:hypothetical protein